MSLTIPTRAIALLSVLVLLGSGAVAAGHHHEDEDAQHDCALCTAGSLHPFVDARSVPSPCLAAAPSLPPGPLGRPRWALYRAHLLSRAPPVAAWYGRAAPHGIRTPPILFATASLVRTPWPGLGSRDGRPVSSPLSVGQIAEREENTR